MTTLNLSHSTRTVLRERIDALYSNESVRLLMVGQQGCYLFFTARQDAAAERPLAEQELLWLTAGTLAPLSLVGYVPLVIVQVRAARNTALEFARHTGKQAMLDALAHRTIQWDSGRNVEDGTAGMRTGILRQCEPYLLFTDKLELVACADPGAAMHLPKWKRAAERWLSMHPTRGKASAA